MHDAGNSGYAEATGASVYNMRDACPLSQREHTDMVMLESLHPPLFVIPHMTDRIFYCHRSNDSAPMRRFVFPCV